MTEELIFEESSGNVFADLGLEDAEEYFTRGKIGIQVLRLLKQRNLKQREVSKLLGIPQPEVSYLMRGEFQRFSEGKLLTFLKRLDTEITLHLRPRHAGIQAAEMAIQLTQPPKPRAAKVIHHLTWEQFEELDRSLEDFVGVKLAYLDGTAEVMPISQEHEDFKSTLVRLIEAYMDEKDIRFYKRGGPSLGDKKLGARNEPDESYNLKTPKPYPDLVIEVVITSGGVDKLEGYRRMGVTEVWFWEDGVLEINRLRPTEYEKLTSSELLPDLPLDLFCRYITYHDQYDAVREFRKAIRLQS